ncbi:MAG: 2-oxoisovalerate dehydrogenase [Candidatus Omnitrophica bacterium]|nr:2-oxoisovalerate dehydrogenase [Candidatus Omnitrophota bacterium]
MTSFSELIFEVKEDEVDGGFVTSALGVGIHTQGEIIEDLKKNIKDAIDCYFDDPQAKPTRVRLHQVPFASSEG